jgi:hypothetical protein
VQKLLSLSASVGTQLIVGLSVRHYPHLRPCLPVQSCPKLNSIITMQKMSLSKAEKHNNNAEDVNAEDIACVYSSSAQELHLLSLCHGSSYGRRSHDFLLPLLRRLPHFVTAPAAAVQQMTN